MVRRCSIPLARQIWSKRWTRYRAVHPSRFLAGYLYSVWTVCSRYGTAAIKPSRKRTAVGRSAFSCKGTKANFEVRSIATNSRACPCCAQLGDVDVKMTDRVRFEFSLAGVLVLDLRQARDAVPLQAAMQQLIGSDAGSSLAAHTGSRRAAVRCADETR